MPCVLDFARTLLEEDLLRVFWPALVEHYSQCCANLYQLMGGTYPTSILHDLL